MLSWSFDLRQKSLRWLAAIGDSKHFITNHRGCKPPSNESSQDWLLCHTPLHCLMVECPYGNRQRIGWMPWVANRHFIPIIFHFSLRSGTGIYRSLVLKLTERSLHEISSITLVFVLQSSFAFQLCTHCRVVEMWQKNGKHMSQAHLCLGWEGMAFLWIL